MEQTPSSSRSKTRQRIRPLTRFKWTRHLFTYQTRCLGNRNLVTKWVINLFLNLQTSLPKLLITSFGIKLLPLQLILSLRLTTCGPIPMPYPRLNPGSMPIPRLNPNPWRPIAKTEHQVDAQRGDCFSKGMGGRFPRQQGRKRAITWVFLDSCDGILPQRNGKHSSFRPPSAFKVENHEQASQQLQRDIQQFVHEPKKWIFFAKGL